MAGSFVSDIVAGVTEALQGCRFDPIRPAKSDRFTGSLDESLSKLVSAVEEFKTSMNIMSNKQRVAGNRRNPRNNVCWWCHKQGHKRAQCPGIQCYYCQKYGHLKRDCPLWWEAQVDNSWQTFNPTGLNQTYYQGRETKM